jgi:uncharacterized protein YukE
MTTPVRVACDALRADATKWSQTAETLQTAAQAAEGLVLGVDKLGFAAQQGGVVAAYEALRRKMIRLLTTGVTELDTLATTLRHAADTYQREDGDGANRIVQAGADQ